MNIRGLWLHSNRNKVKYLRDTATESNAPFIVLTETHLKPEILDAEVKIEGWSLYRTDRGPLKSHGGVAIYLRNDLIGQLVSSHSNNQCESLVVKIKTLNMLLMCVYRPPDATVENFCETIEICQRAIDDVTEKDPKVKDVLILGDFNLPCISWPSGKIYQREIAQKSGEKRQAESLVKFVEKNFLENYITTATRGKNTLDLAFTNNHLLIGGYETIVNKKLSDHYLITISLNFSYNSKTKVPKIKNPYTTKVYEYNLAEAIESDWRRFETVLEGLSRDFEEETKNKNIESKLSKLYENVERATAIVFKKKKDFEEENVDEGKTKKTKNKIPLKIRTLMKRKKKLSSRILASKSWQKNYKTMMELREVEEEIDEEYKRCRAKQEKEAIKTIKHNPKYFYTYAKKFSKSKGEIGAFVKENGEMTDDPAEQAEILRKQYESVASKPFDCLKVDENFFGDKTDEPNEGEVIETCKTDITVARPFVSDCIKMLSANAAPGPDGIPAKMIKEANSSFSSMLNNILQCSIDSGDIPGILKMAFVTPIHKGDSRSEPANFRPVSLTSHLIKTLERVVRRELVSYLETNQLMDVNQHGSRAGKSTLSQLLQNQDEILTAMENGENLDAVYLDFSKAFDKCDHGVLLHKIKRLRIKGKLGKWLQNFLTGRQQVILVNKVKSKYSKLVSGIPQGSVLGPILFLIYISDIGQDLSANTQTLVYVDDTKVKQRVTSEEDVEVMQQELIKLDNWAKTNNMEFNKGKFVVLRYGENEILKEETDYFSGNFEEIIERKQSLRDLGVQLTDDGGFEEQIERVCKKARQKSGWIFRTFYSRNTDFLKQVFKSLVQPHLDYCSQLWAPLEGPDMEKIEKVLRDFSRRIPELRELNYWQRLQRLAMNSEQRRFERYQIIYVWKIIHGVAPNCGIKWSECEERRGQLCEIRKLRGKCSVQKLRRQSFQVAGPRLWNCLPKNVRNFKGNQDDFKQILDQFLSKIPDEPKTEGLIPGAVDQISGKQTNTLIYQVTRRKEIWTDDDLEHHHQEADVTIVL